MNLKPNRATIKEVASAAGVSTQTVSRVINERPDVSPETRKRVQEVIVTLGYQPSALARSLIRQRSYTLGVVTAGLKFIGPSRTLSGITAAAEEAGYALLLKELPYSEEKNIEPILLSFLSRHVDGIIWAVPEIGENRTWIRHHPMDLDVPIVHLTMEPQPGLSIVSIDNRLGGRIATSHLIEQGYRKIGHIAGPLDWWEARQRFAGWRDAILQAGCDYQENHWAEGNWSSASGAQAAEKLLNQYPDLDGIFVANDQMALAVLQIAHQCGKRVPDDLGVVGFDNILESAYFLPSLTTIQQDQYHVAKIAVEEIIKVIESGWQGLDPVEANLLILPPNLVIRQSSLRMSEGGDRRAK